MARGFEYNSRFVRHAFFSRMSLQNSRHNPAMLNFQEVILTLQRYWADRGCAVLQPYDM
jgi:hypothetical protein